MNPRYHFHFIPSFPMHLVSRSLVVALTLIGTSQLAHAVTDVSAESAHVLQAIDGDTLRIELSGKTDKVRIIGIDTPETVDPRKEVQCFGKEASDHMVALTEGKTVTLERNPAEDRDIYDRLLRYVIIDGEDIGFKEISDNLAGSAGYAGDTGTFSRTISDQDDNLKVWYRAKITTYTSGVAVVAVTYPGGGVTGIARITGYNSNTDVDIEVLSRFSDTGTSDNWQQGYWSDARGFPTSVALHGGRLAHANGGSLFLSVSDDYENFDDTTTGDAAPIIRTLGSGPVDNIHYLISILRLIIGTAGAEILLRSSSLDEPVTPDNSSATAFSTQGSANLPAVTIDDQALFVQRTLKRLFMIAYDGTNGDYKTQELTLLVQEANTYRQMTAGEFNQEPFYFAEEKN